ncbi:hypothetical protein UFOVP1666_44 [uncultured Caudovirales phage]|uniref:Uncharacterized protein n=1 Tax=uncultured Caudovirales phage TaxID=2100421 RepID=A0A6J5T5C7_9CAUD|nr:hypothetical protein UFOVP867_197 [uncultured Caudovirales phage]CAB4170352.1 hypothetical protein UFOVP913_2 [uncultured Caudovirales phage]CAB4176765.1 hypothetical protein UFOVP993_55 [uncultured Caudovirales phage]CAB4222995.1 hypothetical protein UFOVP1666_44 [uncultured Caudovirales phage]
MENLNTEFKITGKVTINRFDYTGALVETIETNNLVVTAGKVFIASRMAGTASGVMSHMAVGNGATPPDAADTDLGGILGTRVALTSGVASTNTVTYTCTFPAGSGTGSLVEAGIFNASTAGTMLCRTAFATITKGALDVISITWIVTVS